MIKVDFDPRLQLATISGEKGFTQIAMSEQAAAALATVTQAEYRVREL